MAKILAALLFACLCFLPLKANGPNDPAKKDKTQPDAAQKAADADELAKLGKVRLDAAQKAYKEWAKDINRLLSSALLLTGYQLSVNWLSAELDVAKKKDERIAAFAAHHNRMHTWGKRLLDDVGGIRGEYTTIVCDSFTKEAEFWLIRERRKDKQVIPD